VPTGQAPAARTSGTSISTSTLASLQNARVARLDAERTAKLEHFLRLADESVQRKDPLGEANALQLALSIIPDDAALKARADSASLRAAEVMAEKYIEHAREAESQHRWEVAAEYWQRAAVGRPRDAGVLLKAAGAVLRVGKELPKAADLAKRAVAVQPRVDAYALLADIYIAAGMRASAQVAVDAAAKLDPNSPVVKDLLARAKA
jgi:tetratricopeptide (TPR) repeat protein